MEIGDLIRQAARRHGDAPAIECEERVLSFNQFNDATDRLGNSLLKLGLLPGDRVGVLLPNGIEGLIVYYALAKSGLVRVSLNHRDSHQDHLHRIADSEARAMISEDASSFPVEVSIDLEQLEQLISDGSPIACDVGRSAQAPYRIGYTGGTTGPPKGVVLTMANEYAEITNYLIDLIPGIGTGDVMVHAAPVTHASGSFFLPHLIRGAKNIILSKFEPSRYLEALEQIGATSTFLVPTMISMVLEEPNINDLDFSKLKRLCYGASPIAPSVVERAEAAFGKILTQTYGQSEAPMTLTLLRPEEHHRVGSAGEPYSMVEVRVFDEEDKELPIGAEGEIVARGQIVMSGYWKRANETEETLRGGWLHTGDIGRIDQDGFVYLLDRRHDIIISGGFNVYPREVEDALQSHPMVKEAAVVGVADAKWGEAVKAVVSVRGDTSEEELLSFVRERVARYKCPRYVEIWEDLPKSSAGKILRKEVRGRLKAAEVQEN
ncbi:class I adenylate-forming enzyme family protein [Acidithrix ferrooxidans]|uniref:Long-chain-fatty-acid--CoA ligase n=1 Tax=Acidithrix ferrooxidans TaxID=1280514 RepID=A0A0D8HLD6_9ACTN|nr:AMP-binding protein [Acidithrix ferrooxidans]KJF18664.1 long-chain-fatty-acid--CoA ligase [Acidithrix ferrooxidans]